MIVGNVNVLKIDKDCFGGRHWEQEFLCLIMTVCRRYGVMVLSVKKCNSHHKGVHYYIEIDPPVDADLALMLQYLLGDDCQRVDHNRARIDSGSPRDWNKLFEDAGTKLRTVYRHVRVLPHSIHLSLRGRLLLRTPNVEILR